MFSISSATSSTSTSRTTARSPNSTLPPDTAAANNNNVAQPIIKCHPKNHYPVISCWVSMASSPPTNLMNNVPSTSLSANANSHPKTPTSRRYYSDFCTKCGVDISRFSHEDFCPEF
ncbi:hypothetical protein BDC45DRAFT_520065 [Circinella umbellata]|nr:hypothetical protein BDC45DRAFT_520065 [Circinella umbellata]